MPRTDLASDYDIDAAAIDAFRKNGHVTVHGVLPPAALKAFRPAIAAVVAEGMREARKRGRVHGFAPFLAQATNVWRTSDAARRLVFSRRLASIAARLLRVESVRLYHDQAVFKPGGSSRTPWHRDSYYWPLDPRKVLTLWLPLVDVTADMGPIELASGSHRPPLAGSQPLSPKTDRRLAQIIARRRWPVSTGPVRLGDAVFHAAATVHAAGPNRTRRTRAVLTVIYYADGLTARTPANVHQEVDLEVSLPGVRPGQLAAGRWNPVLYP